MDLQVQDTDLAQVLQMLSIQSEKNIIAGRDVSGTVTASLYDVTFYEALEAVLAATGYRYIEEGNFIYVYTQAQYDEIMQARKKTLTRTFPLQYLSATDAHEFIAPLLSDRGQSAFRGDVAPGFKPDESDGGADTYAFSATLVVNDYAENLDDISNLLSELDTEPQQVLVEATILQTELDESNAAGVDFSLIGDADFTNLTDPLGMVNNLLDGDDPDTGFQPADDKAYGLTSSAGNTQGPGTFKVGIVNDSVAVFIKLLDSVQDTTVLARPKIMVLNRQRAEVLVGARIGYLSTTATQTTTTQTVEFLDTGIQLVFRPFISPNGMIRMELSPRVSEASLRTVTDANAVLVTIPDEITNELTTNVRVRDGKTLVLGGLFREKTDISRRQVPLLGDVPLLGWAFRGQEDIVDRDEIVFLITPNIVHDEKLWDIGEDTMEYARAFVVGGRDGLLPFSRDKLTSGYNQDATAAFNRGDHDMALYYINNSLRLRPMQPEMIRFRERVTGAVEQPHLRSMMERVLKSHLHSDMESARENIRQWKSTAQLPGSWSNEHSTSTLGQPPHWIEIESTQSDKGATTTNSAEANSPVSSNDSLEADGSAEDAVEVTEADTDPFETGASTSFDDAPGIDGMEITEPGFSIDSNVELTSAFSDEPGFESSPEQSTATESTDFSAETTADASQSMTDWYDSTESSEPSESQQSSTTWESDSFESNERVESYSSSFDDSEVVSGDDWSRSDNEFYRNFLADFFKAIGMPTMTGPATATFQGISQADYDVHEGASDMPSALQQTDYAGAVSDSVIEE